MSSPCPQAKISPRQSLAERCFSSEMGLCQAKGGGVLLSKLPTTLLDNWNTGTMLLLRCVSGGFPWRDCLAKEIFKPRENSRKARSSGSFLTDLLEYWNTGTELSPLPPCRRASEIICLAGQRFIRGLAHRFGVATSGLQIFFDGRALVGS